ncbi:hypothetical protein PpBr36_01578 [Pyricularia pennisetigena]|uniref:hypothetical protein n=1 Tax=Pyricularia pennisetigena TaxID=1578925 RepID=UPI00114FAFAD|nr:hypothetical protein PpBr36_01578 [Pyricularia pennisetigena]TLS28416.1 hypothetical protein PpBr36_01578 [Pyricularia pennisetigena]
MRSQLVQCSNVIYRDAFQGSVGAISARVIVDHFLPIIYNNSTLVKTAEVCFGMRKV